MVETHVARPAAARRRPTRPQGRTGDPVATRQALFRAGSALFAEKGYDGTTVEEIAQAARANRAAISYHFGGKERLYGAILTERLAEVGSRLQGLLDTSKPADALLRDYIACFADVVAASPDFVPLFVREMLAGGRHIEANALPRVLAVFSVVREIIERGTKEGAFRRASPIGTHFCVVGSLLFFFLIGPFRERLKASGRLPAPVPAAPEFAQHLQDLISRGLAAEPARRTKTHRRATGGRHA
jgi:AcrR family transcriptional regulator